MDERALIDVIRAVPAGRVATYGQLAALAGNPRGARRVVWLLRQRSGELNLPWHRVINAQGRLSLPRGGGFEVQRALLVDEGVAVDADGRVDLRAFRWSGETE